MWGPPANKAIAPAVARIPTVVCAFKANAFANLAFQDLPVLGCSAPMDAVETGCVTQRRDCAHATKGRRAWIVVNWIACPTGIPAMARESAVPANAFANLRLWGNGANPKYARWAEVNWNAVATACVATTVLAIAHRAVVVWPVKKTCV